MDYEALIAEAEAELGVEPGEMAETFPPKFRHDLDRSTAFSILLDLSPEFANSPPDGGVTLNRFLADWYEDASSNMYEFARRWLNKEGPAA